MMIHVGSPIGLYLPFSLLLNSFPILYSAGFHSIGLQRYVVPDLLEIYEKRKKNSLIIFKQQIIFRYYFLYGVIYRSKKMVPIMYTIKFYGQYF